VLEGLIFGVLMMNEFVLVKSMQGSVYQVSIVVQIPVVVLLFSSLFNEILKQSTNKIRLLRRIAFFTRLPLLLFLLFPRTPDSYLNTHIYHYLFMAIFFVYQLASPVVLPVINLLLRNSYSKETFGKLFGYSVSLNRVMSLVSTLLFGLLLDYDHFSFVYIYPLIGILGLVEIIAITLMPYKNAAKQAVSAGIIQSVKGSLLTMWHILRDNRPYRFFQAGFMFYGIAWMFSAALVPIFFEEILHLNYASIAFYKNAYNLIVIVLVPYFGRLLDKTDPRKYAAYAFLMLLFYLLFFIMTQFFPYYIQVWNFSIYYTLIIAYIFYGMFTTQMQLLWFIGSSYFCGNDDAANYQALHLTLTGVRAVFAPVLGVVAFGVIGFSGVFVSGIGSLVLAIFMVVYSRKKHEME